MIYIPMVEVASKLQVYHPLLFHMEEYQFEGWILSVSDAKQREWHFHQQLINWNKIN